MDALLQTRPLSTASTNSTASSSTSKPQHRPHYTSASAQEHADETLRASPTPNASVSHEQGQVHPADGDNLPSADGDIVASSATTMTTTMTTTTTLARNHNDGDGDDEDKREEEEAQDHDDVASLRPLGLVDDCPVFRGLDLYVRSVAGAALKAGDELRAGRCSGTFDFKCVYTVAVISLAHALTPCITARIAVRLWNCTIDALTHVCSILFSARHHLSHTHVHLLRAVGMSLEGGRHHAFLDRVAGFCYVNDVVLAVMRLQEPPKAIVKLAGNSDDLGNDESTATTAATADRIGVEFKDSEKRSSGGDAAAAAAAAIVHDHSFRRVLVVDTDAHHGDAVQSAFAHSEDVFTLSFHRHGPGFYPGTGALHDVGPVNLSFTEGDADCVEESTEANSNECATAPPVASDDRDSIPVLSSSSPSSPSSPSSSPRVKHADITDGDAGASAISEKEGSGCGGDGSNSGGTRADAVINNAIHSHGGPPRPTSLSPTVSALNIPLPRHVTDHVYVPLFRAVVDAVMASFRPDAVVMVLGADALFGDPLGELALSTAGLCACVGHLMKRCCAGTRTGGENANDDGNTGDSSRNDESNESSQSSSPSPWPTVPLLILGGGGYSPSNTSRLWTLVCAHVARSMEMMTSTSRSGEGNRNSNTTTTWMHDVRVDEDHEKSHLPPLSSSSPPTSSLSSSSPPIFCTNVADVTSYCPVSPAIPLHDPASYQLFAPHFDLLSPRPQPPHAVELAEHLAAAKRALRWTRRVLGCESGRVIEEKGAREEERRSELCEGMPSEQH